MTEPRLWIKTDNGAYVNFAAVMAIDKVPNMPNAAQEDRWHLWVAPGKWYWLTMPEGELVKLWETAEPACR